MILANKWTDYDILATGDGLKKERWGDIILVRPDPQVIWPNQNKDWGLYDGFYHRSEKGGGTWDFQKKIPSYWTIDYRNLTFKISPTNFKHTGLFPEQAVNWDWITSLVNAKSQPTNILNLFGYTGAATVAAAAAGASVCHVDAAKGMVQWCRENAELSGLAKAPIRYIVDDCLKFVEREIRRGNRYDGIIMDPPSYGRGKKGEIWKLESSLYPFLEKVIQLLSTDPLFFLVNTYTTGLSATVIGNMLRATLGKHKGKITSGEIGLPAQPDNFILPCGTYGRWQADA